MYLSTKYLKLKLLCRKLGPKYIGPFPIVKVTIELKPPRILSQVQPVFHCRLLKPAQASRLRSVVRDALAPIIVEGETHYEIKRISYVTSDMCD